MQTGNTNYIYRNDLDKAYFHHDIAFKDNLLLKTTFGVLI